MTRTEKIEKVIEIMKEYFTTPDFVILHDDYEDSEGAITKINGTIYPMDSFDDMLEDLDIPTFEAIRATQHGKFDIDDDACWYDKTDGKIYSISECDFFDWVHKENFAEFVLDLRENIKKYALNEEAERKILALSEDKDILYLIEKDGKTEVTDHADYGVKAIFQIYTNYCEPADITYIMAENLMDDSIGNLEVVNFCFGKDDGSDDGYIMWMAKKGIMRLFGK